MQTHTDSQEVGPLRGVAKVAELLDVDPSTVRRYIDSGELRSLKIGGRRLVADSDLAAFIEKHRA